MSRAHNGRAGEEINKQVNRFARNQLSFISGTISPPAALQANETREAELEGIKSALYYYKSKGVEAVVLQPKYMGSRGTLYLTRNRHEVKLVSRNGHIIKEERHCPEETKKMKALLDREYKKFMESATFDNEISSVIIDGELLPWSAIGSTLIDREFRALSVVDKLQDEYLEESGLKAKLKEAASKLEPKEREILDLLVNNEAHKEKLDAYDSQVEKHGVEADEFTFKPFNLLKVIRKDGKETVTIGNNGINFELVSDDTQITLNLAEFDIENTDLEDAMQVLWDGDLEEEGIMVKPVVHPTKGEVVPALKVRMPNYLRMVYGVDYDEPQALAKHIKHKNVYRKMKDSIKQYKLGVRLLNIPSGTIHYNAERYEELITDALTNILLAERDDDARL